jgi:hypothetical protein
MMLLRLCWEESLQEHELMRMNESFQQSDGKDTYAVNATIQLDLLHAHLQRAKLEVELYARSEHLMKKDEFKGCQYLIE